MVIIKDRNGEEVKDYTGYVPRFLDPYRDGYGDFDNDLDDIFSDDED